MSNESTTTATHPFVLDLLAGWSQFVGDERYAEKYQQITYDLYQKAGNEAVAWGDEGRDLTLAEQFEWLMRQLPGVVRQLEAIEGVVHTPAPAKPEPEKLAPGIYFDNARGWHISSEVVALALNAGWDPYFSTDALQYATAIACLKTAGVYAFEAFIQALPDDGLSSILHDLESEATEFISENLIPEGCWCGYSDYLGDWGVWENEEEQ